MPQRAARPCKHGGCRQIATSSGLCGSHAAQPSARRTFDSWRGSSHERGYDRAWRAVRALALERDRHLCVACRKANQLTPATEVDHILPIARGGGRLELDNLQSLCKPCHSRKTATEDSGFARRRR